MLMLEHPLKWIKVSYFSLACSSSFRPIRSRTCILLPMFWNSAHCQGVPRQYIPKRSHMRCGCLPVHFNSDLAVAQTRLTEQTFVRPVLFELVPTCHLLSTLYLRDSRLATPQPWQRSGYWHEPVPLALDSFSRLCFYPVLYRMN